MDPTHWPALALGASPVLAAAVAFFAVFAVFVVAFLVLAVITVRWAVRRDRTGRAEWQRRRDAEGAPGSPKPSTNGRPPGRRDQRGGEPRPG